MEKHAENLNRKQRQFVKEHGRQTLQRVRTLRQEGKSNMDISEQLKIPVEQLVVV